LDLTTIVNRKQQEEKELTTLHQDLALTQRDFLYYTQTLRQEIALVGVVQTNKGEISLLQQSQALLALGCSAFLYDTEQSLGGSLDELALLSRSVEFPVLRRDILLSTVAVYTSRAFGADAVWLQTELLSEGQLQELIAAAERCRMVPVAAAFHGDGLQKAINSTAPVIALSANFPVRQEKSVLRRLLPLVPTGRVLLVEGEDPVWLRGKTDALLVHTSMPESLEATEPLLI
jgi:indole-3-glycerol phosphate synthase